MQKQKKYIFYIISCLCLGTAVFSGFYIYRSTMTKWFAALPASRIMPSGSALAILWAVSFAVTFSAYLLTCEEKEHLLFELGETLYLAVLLLCLLWPISFFHLQSPIIGIIDMSLIMFLVFLTAAVFFKISSATMWLMIWYIAIMTFIFHMNLYIVLKLYGILVK